MAVTMCPGQNMAFWRPDDIFDITCPNCGTAVEFFKDEARRRCSGCGHVFVNPKLNEGCAKWCKFADKCLGLNDDVRLDNDDDNEETQAGPARPKTAEHTEAGL